MVDLFYTSYMPENWAFRSDPFILELAIFNVQIQLHCSMHESDDSAKAPLGVQNQPIEHKDGSYSHYFPEAQIVG